MRRSNERARVTTDDAIHRAIDAHHLLLGRVNAASQDSRFDRSVVTSHAHDTARIDPLVQRRRQPPGGLVASDDTGQNRAATKRGHVVRRIATCARHDLRRVVLEDQHRSLARDARDTTVHEFIGDDVADDGHRSLLQRVYDREELRRIHPTASIKLLRIASACTPSGAIRPVWARADEHRARTRGTATGNVEPAIAHHHGLRWIEVHLPAGLLNHPGRGLATEALLPVAIDLRFGKVGTVVIAVDAGASALQPAIDLAMDGVNEVLLDDSAPDGRLVRDHDRRESRPLEQSQGVGRPRKQRQRLEAIEVAALLDDACRRDRERPPAAHDLGPGTGFRDPDDRDSGSVIRSVTARITRSGESPFMQR